MVHIEASDTRRSPLIAGVAIAVALGLLSACGGGSSSAPYISTAAGSAAGSSTGGSSGAGTGGGGATGAASPYVLFGSTYLAYAAQTNGAYLHTAQGGDVYTGQGGSWFFSSSNGGYSSSQAAMNSTGLYIFQTKAGVAPITLNDYMYVAVSAPANSTADISQATTLLIQMGNSVTPPGATAGNAHVFTVDLNNAKGSTAATEDCSYDQTLAEIGSGVAGPPGSALGVRTYAIPLANLTCAQGSSVSGLLAAGITTVAVKITGDKNPGLPAGEIDNINIGMIAFSGALSTTDAATLAQQ